MNSRMTAILGTSTRKRLWLPREGRWYCEAPRERAWGSLGGGGRWSRGMPAETSQCLYCSIRILDAKIQVPIPTPIDGIKTRMFLPNTQVGKTRCWGGGVPLTVWKPRGDCAVDRLDGPPINHCLLSSQQFFLTGFITVFNDKLRRNLVSSFNHVYLL